MDDDQSAPGGALSIDTATRKALKAQAHPLKPVVMIGDAGLSDSVLAEIVRALESHQLIKIRVLGDDREAREALMQAICERAGCAPVQRIGKLLVVWRPSSEAGAPGGAGGNTARRRRPKEPYQPKKAVGAGAVSTRRAAGARGSAVGASGSAAGARGGAAGPKAGAAGARRSAVGAKATAAGSTERPRRSLRGVVTKGGSAARGAERARPLARGAARGPVGDADSGRPKRPGRSPRAASKAAKKPGAKKR